MDRYDFQSLTRTRIRDARILIRERRYEAAYYLVGYAVECALKACIAKKTKRFEFPDKESVISSYSHKLFELAKVAGLQSVLESEKRSDPQFAANWLACLEWSEKARYGSVSELQARNLFSAVTDPKGGVVRWLRMHW